MCVLIEFGKEINEDINKKVRILCVYFDKYLFNGMIEYVFVFFSVFIIYDFLYMKSEFFYEVVKDILEDMIFDFDFLLNDEEYIVEILVCYGGEFGLDIEYVVEINNIIVDDVIKIYFEGKYLVYMIGFVLGFFYLGGMLEKIVVLRCEFLRIVILAGLVGIVGM